MLGAYDRWCHTASTRAHYFEKFREMCGLIYDPVCPKAAKHKRKLRHLKSIRVRTEVQHTITVICNFTNLFPLQLADKDYLYSIASGAPVSFEELY